MGGVENRPLQIRLPALQRLYAHYCQLKSGRELPNVEDIDLSELAFISEYVVLMSVQDGGADFLYRFCGPGYIRICGEDYTGLRLSEMRDTEWVRAAKRMYNHVATSRIPVCFHILHGSEVDYVGHYTKNLWREPRRLKTLRDRVFERLILPFEYDGEVRTLLCATLHALPDKAE